MGQTDGRTDGRTDRQTDRQTDSPKTLSLLFKGDKHKQRVYDVIVWHQYIDVYSKSIYHSSVVSQQFQHFKRSIGLKLHKLHQAYFITVKDH